MTVMIDLNRYDAKGGFHPISDNANKRLIALSAVNDQDMCNAKHNYLPHPTEPTGYVCTRFNGHKGPHVAHGYNENDELTTVAVWRDECGRDVVEHFAQFGFTKEQALDPKHRYAIMALRSIGIPVSDIAMVAGLRSPSEPSELSLDDLLF